MECKQIYNTGLRSYMLDSYNIIDFSVLSLYLASYTLRFLVDRWIKAADAFYNGTSRARDSLTERNRTEYDLIVNEIFSDDEQPLHSYFMKACTSTTFSYISKSIYSLQRYGPFSPENCPLPWGDLDPSNTWSLWPTPVLNPNSISIGAAVFCRAH